MSRPAWRHATALAAVTVLATATVVPAAPPAPPAPGNADPDVAVSHVLVRVRPGVTLIEMAGGRPVFADAVRDATPAGRRDRRQLAAALERRGVRGVEPALHRRPDRAAPGSRLDRTYRVLLPPGADPRAVVAELATHATRIEHAEVDVLGEVADTVPDDSAFGEQWGLRNTGQSVGGTPGTPGADVDAVRAWDLTTGSPSIVLAVLDSGVDPHVEIAARMLPGWNFPSGNADTSDSCNHGTHVTGIAAAAGNNAAGIAGMAWTVQILPMRVINGCAGATSADLADGLVAATDAGADVINISMQFPGSTQVMLDAVRYAADARVIVVAAAGNFGGTVAFPGRYPETIAVGATTNLDVPWPGTNPGEEVDVAAPGWNIWSLTVDGEGGSGYEYKSGTSMATPFVSGLACLMKSIDSRLDTDEAREILAATATDISLPGEDVYTGAGRIEAYEALVMTQDLADRGDANLDGAVDVADLLLILAAWGPCPAPPAACPGDFDDSGVVDVTDLTEVLDRWDG
ncbi:MAG: S8 family serine peptidase [Planctomycetota bacterium]|jgi:subtilisin family serine protease